MKKITTPQADGTDKVQYAVFYKAKNANVMNQALTAYQKRVADRKKNPPLLDKLKAKLQKSKAQNRERTREKTKTRGQER